MADYTKHMDVGPGGIRCACCAPAPGTPERRKMFRVARRRSKEQAIAEGMAEYKENEMENRTKDNNFYAVGFEDGSVWDFQHEDKMDFLNSDCLANDQSLAEDIARREDGVVMQFGLTLKDSYKF